MLFTSGSQRRRCVLAGAGMLVSLAGANAAIAQSFCQYEITAVIEGPDCAIFGPADVVLEDINELGQACGSFKSCATSQNQPFAWSEETGFVILPLPPGATHGEAVSINNVLGSDGLGQVACTLIAGAHRAYLYDDGVWTLLPPEPGGLVSIADSVNDHSQVLGWRSNSGSFLWQERVFTDLIPELGENPHDLNEFSQVCGTILATDVGFLWDGGLVEEIPPLPGTDTSLAFAMNLHERVVGFSNIVSKGIDPARAWLYEFPKLVQLPHPDEYLSTFAFDVNDAGQILIHALTPTLFTDIYLYQNGHMVEVVDLVDPLPGVIFSGSSAEVINDRGQIGARGISFNGPALAGLILTPVNRPLGDVNFDCSVDAYDLAMVLGQWGPCPEVGSCLCDIVSRETFQPPGDGVVDAADLAVILGDWTVPSGGTAPANRR